MKNYLTVTVLAAAAALVSLAAQAQTAPLTRAQVAAELQQARSSGALERMASEGFGLPTPVIRKAAPVSASAEAAARPQAPDAQPQGQGRLTGAEAQSRGVHGAEPLASTSP